LATGGPLLELARIAENPAVVIGTPAELATTMSRSRPRLVILAAPPAGPAEIALVAAERQRRPSLRILLVNDPASVDERLRALANGFDEALPASVSAGELAGRARLLAAPRGRSSGVVAIGEGIELDLVAQELRRDGVAIHLRPKELRLLTLLASHPGRVYTRRQLLDRVWGQGVESDPRTVDVHVRWLRSKVEADPEHPRHLVTVRGIGYRLDGPER
jgi:DNA-binding response OmpR family regulator